MNLTDEFLLDPERKLLFQQEKLVLDVTERICELMQEQKISQADLARKLGHSRSAVSQALDGSTNMTLGKVAEFFNALGHEASISSRPYAVVGRPRVVIQDSDEEPEAKNRSPDDKDPMPYAVAA